MHSSSEYRQSRPYCEHFVIKCLRGSNLPPGAPSTPLLPFVNPNDSVTNERLEQVPGAWFPPIPPIPPILKQKVDPQTYTRDYSSRFRGGETTNGPFNLPLQDVAAQVVTLGPGRSIRRQEYFACGGICGEEKRKKRSSASTIHGVGVGVC